MHRHRTEFFVVAALTAVLLFGCVSPAAVQQPVISGAYGDADDASSLATSFLRDYMSDYGLASESKSFEIVIFDVISMDATNGGGGVALIGRCRLFRDNSEWDAYAVTATVSGATAETARRNLANRAAGMIGDPLIGYLSRGEYDYRTENLGGYGLLIESIFGVDADVAVLRAFTTDIVAAARSILQAAEPVLLDNFANQSHDYEVGEPVAILQLTLIGTDRSADGGVTVSALFDETGELSSALNDRVDWPRVRGMYSVSLGWGRL